MPTKQTMKKKIKFTLDLYKKIKQVVLLKTETRAKKLL